MDIAMDIKLIFSGSAQNKHSDHHYRHHWPKHIHPGYQLGYYGHHYQYHNYNWHPNGKHCLNIDSNINLMSININITRIFCRIVPKSLALAEGLWGTLAPFGAFPHMHKKQFPEFFSLSRRTQMFDFLGTNVMKLALLGIEIYS